MFIRCIGSGSTGNSYALFCDNEILLIDLGMSRKDILKAVDFNVSDIVGCLVSHEHS